MWRHREASRRLFPGVSAATLCCSPPSPSLAVIIVGRRSSSTGEHHTYRPGPVARGIRALFTTLTPVGLRSRVALRLQVGLERVEVLEKEQQWLQQHGSPLAVMGLPDHAELEEVKRRYRDLILETHPDTSNTALPSSPVTSSSSSLPDPAVASDGGHAMRDPLVTPATATAPTAASEASQQRAGAARRYRELSPTDEYHILQAAYRMAMNPDSLWHRSGSAPALYESLTAHRSVWLRGRTPTNIFAFACYAWMLFVGIVVANKAFAILCDKGLQFADPEFYAFMTAQEKEEQRKRDAGEFVDVDPLRLAPTAVRKLAYPGRFVHGIEMTPERAHLSQQQREQELQLVGKGAV